MSDSDDPSMRDILETHLEDRDSKWHETKPGVYHASSAGYCKRKAYYRIQGLDEDLPLGLFRMGEMVEDVVEAALRDEYGERFVKNAVPVKHDAGEFAVVGSTDPVVLGYNGDILRVYEVKSSESKLENRVKDQHLLQAGFYGHLLDAPVHVVHPGRSDVLEIPDDDVAMDAKECEVRFREAMEWFEDLHGYVAESELPPATPSGGWECQWCDFRERCRQDGGWAKVHKKRGEGWRWMRESDPKRDSYETWGDKEG